MQRTLGTTHSSGVEGVTFVAYFVAESMLMSDFEDMCSGCSPSVMLLERWDSLTELILEEYFD